jgi:uncharacterized protein (DUF305 family)
MTSASPRLPAVARSAKAGLRVSLLSVVLAAGCGTGGAVTAPHTVQPGAPGEPSREVPAGKQAAPPFTPADVQFMQGMIGHHQQAVDMTGLLKTRTTREDMKMLALRIEVSQTDEIKMMQRWLEQRGQQAPSIHAMHMHGATLMPGMLTEDEMAALAAATGAEFDRLFLEGMIKHHGGALTMVKELFAAGGGQQAEIFTFASDVEADQKMEIERMKGMLRKEDVR